VAPRLAGNRFDHLARAFDEAKDHRAERSIPQSHDVDWPWASRKINGQHFEQVEMHDRLWHCGNELPAAKELGNDRHGQRFHAGLRHGEALRMEDLSQALVIPGLWRLHNPIRVDQLGKINLAATGRPFVPDAGRDHQGIIEKSFSSPGCS
jgi:hypothetical protein